MKLALISCILEFFCKNLKLIPVIGIELEFYCGSLQDRNSVRCMDGMLDIVNKIRKNFKWIKEVKPETGMNQFEIVTIPSFEVEAAIKDLLLFKAQLCDNAKKYDLSLDFAAKPFLEFPGNSLHVNLTFYSLENEAIVGSEHMVFSWIIAGMCEYMKSSMLCFAPSVNSYSRFHYPDLYTPLFVNWGFNNRTAALRVVSGKYRDFRIEHRVSGADADIKEVISIILLSIIWGIKNKLKKPMSEFGIMHYNHGYERRLPMTLTESRRFYKQLDVDFL